MILWFLTWKYRSRELSSNGPLARQERHASQEWPWRDHHGPQQFCARPGGRSLPDAPRPCRSPRAGAGPTGAAQPARPAGPVAPPRREEGQRPPRAQSAEQAGRRRLIYLGEPRLLHFVCRSGALLISKRIAPVENFFQLWYNTF